MAAEPQAETDTCMLHRLHELADEATKQKADQLRNRLSNDKLQVTCRHGIRNICSCGFGLAEKRLAKDQAAPMSVATTTAIIAPTSKAAIAIASVIVSCHYDLCYKFCSFIACVFVVDLGICVVPML